MAPYRPPGRSNRSGRTQADNEVFEGLPVKQWSRSYARVSLAPPVSENVNGAEDRWGDPPMPRDYQLLQPWTQHLLRLARSGKVGTKRKQDSELVDDEKPEDETIDDARNLEDRGYVAMKWKPVPETLLEPEHKHFEFLAKRRKGLPSLYGGALNGAHVPMRKTKVQKVGADGEVFVYEVLVPEGQVVEGEVTESAELLEVKPVSAAPGTIIDGLGIANDDGVIVAEHLKPNNAPRRNRPPPKKKGGPGRGKKRVTFTNPDGSTYTTIVPNATKIVPQPGQTVKHVAKGEEATADVSAAEAAASAPSQDQQEGDGEGDGEGDEGEDSDDDGEDGDDDDDREEGELSEEDAPADGNDTPVHAVHSGAVPVVKVEDNRPDPLPSTDLADIEADDSMMESAALAREPSSSPELPLANAQPPQGQAILASPAEADDAAKHTSLVADDTIPADLTPPLHEDAGGADTAGEDVASPDAATADDVEDDLLGNLEKHLEGEHETG